MHLYQFSVVFINNMIKNNRWIILKDVGTNKHGQTLSLCRCECGTERIVIKTAIKQNHSKSCGCLQKEIASQQFRKLGKSQVGKNNPRWKGGKFIRRGYVFIHSPNHPRTTQKYVLEHVLVMEKKLGRFLLPNETVHHKNGIKHDNRIDNLELWSSNHPSGQRAEDLIKHAKEILMTYKDYQ